MRISDWSSDVCSSDLRGQQFAEPIAFHRAAIARGAMDEDVGLRPLGRLVQYLAAAPARGDGLAAGERIAVGTAADDRDLGELADPAFVRDLGHRGSFGAEGDRKSTRLNSSH